MNDEKIKNLLTTDSYCPESKFDEWSLIKNKMETKKSSKSKIGLVLCSFVLCFVISKQLFINSADVSNEEVMAYLFDNTYDEMEDDSLYAWID